MEKKYYTVKELHKVIALPEWSIRKLIRLGVLPAYKLDKKNYLLKLQEVIAIIEKSKF